MTAAADAATARAPTSGAGILQMPDRTASPSLSAGAAAADPSSSRALTARRPDRLTKQQSQQQQQQQADPLSDRATALLIRRTLCPQLQQQQQVGGANDNGRDGQQQAPIEEILQLLPPLTSRNDVDLQLYAFLAIVLREFVQSWYTRITSDEAFVAEVVHIIAHCTRALEQRCRKLDLESLLLDEIPDLLNRHITGKPRCTWSCIRYLAMLWFADVVLLAYRVAQEPVSQPPVEAHAREIYHALCPLPYLSPVPRSDDPDSVANQLDNERAYREMLVEAVLTILLPTEDLENPCLTAIVGQIFSELIIGNIVANKAAQPWLLLEAIGIGCRAAAGKKNDKSSSSNDDNGSSSSSSEKRSSQATGLDLDASQRQRWKESTVQGFFVSIIRFGVLAWGAIRFLVTTLVMSSSLPPRDAWLVEKGGLRDSFHSSFSSSSPSASTSAKVPVVTFRVWSCVGNLIQLPTRMPWLSGFLSLVQYGAALGPGRIAGLNSRIDR
jgi:splicing suppressor protein 51